MNKKPYLSLEDAQCIIAACRESANKKNYPLVAVAVCDDGGNVIAMERSPEVPPVSANIAINKARTAALGRRDSRIYEEQINNGRQALLSAPDIAGLMSGGVPVIFENMCIGAVGVSNLKPDQDEEVAKAGLDHFSANYSA
ncbi:heme-binding protein [Betaproteobacteria bacterium]|nr:heme-binding protein [Betaproteobacteria bacterium]